jgi:integrin beta 3
MDFKALTDGLYEAVKGYIARSMAPMQAKLAELESREPIHGRDGKDGKDGKDADPDAIKAAVAAAVSALPAPLNGKDGKDADPDAIKAAVDAAVSALPAPLNGRDGKDADAEEVARSLEASLEKRLTDLIDTAADARMTMVIERAAALVPRPADGNDGAHGKDADPALIAELVRKAVSEIPSPAAGKDGQDGRDAAQLEILDGIDPFKRHHRGTYASHRGSIVRAFRATDPMPEGGDLEKSGWHVVVRGVADPIEDADPQAIERLLVPLFEKRMDQSIAHVVESALPDVIAKAAALIPKPSDGRDGRDGIDGMTPESIECRQKGDREFEIVVRGGGRVMSADIRLPSFLDRGVYATGKSYETGDGVTYAGSYWIAQADTAEKPGEGKGWRLAVKRGRDGKDAVARET